MSGPFAGAEMRTRGAPALRCPSAFSRSVKRPVHSRTRSALFAAWGRSAGDFVAVTWISFPLTTIPFSVAFTSAARTPWTESYLRRWARVFVSVRSLIETNSRSFSPRSIAARTMHRPIRPKPLIAIRAIVFPPRVRVRVRGRKEAPKLPSDPGGVNGNAGAASRQKRRGGGLRVLVLEALRHEIDELGGEVQDLVRRVAVAAQLLEERLCEDLRSLVVENGWHHCVLPGARLRSAA